MNIKFAYPQPSSALGEKAIKPAAAAPLTARRDGHAAKRWGRRCITHAVMIVFVVWALLFNTSIEAYAQPTPGSLANVLGANHFDLLMQYLGYASNADGSPAAQIVTRAMGLKAIRDASNYSFRFFRVAIAGYGPNTYLSSSSPTDNYSLKLWQTNPSAYWTLVDNMFTDLDANGIKIVAVLDFNWTYFPALTGETVSDMIKNPNSSSRLLQNQYISQFINRYKNRNTILFYELGNELNLGADIDNVTYCLSQNAQYPLQCETTGNYSSSDLLKFSYQMVTFVKSVDSSREISSGFSLPRTAAYHLASQPQYAASGGNWTSDTPSQFAYFLNYMNSPFDITSAHIYAGDVRFGRPSGTEWQTLRDVVVAAHQAGKRVYLGEFAGNISDGVTPYISSMLKELAQLQVDYASPWTFEFYQFATYLSSNVGNTDPNSLEPGVTDTLLQTYSNTAQKKRNSSLSAGANSGTSRELPQIVIASPWPCQAAKNAVTVYALASSPSGIERVEFYANGTMVASASQPPFSAVVPLTSSGVVTLTAKAYAASGLSSVYETPVVANGARATCQLPSG